MTRVSVIVPAFEVEGYLDACLESVTNQHHRDLDIVVVDDGSTDASGLIADKWAERDARIRVLHQENRGLSTARNEGIEAAAGEYLMFVDSDDLVAEDLVGDLLTAAEQVGADVTISQLVPFQDGAIPRFSLADGPTRISDTTTALVEIVAVRANWSPCGKLFNRRIFDEGIRFRSGILYEDLDFTPRAIAAADQVAHIESAGYGYRQRAQSIMDHSRKVMSPDLIDVLDRNIEHARAILGSGSVEFNQLLRAYVVHAARTVELMNGPQHLKANHAYLNEYRRFIDRHLSELARKRLMSVPYLVLLRLSRISPAAFNTMFGVARRAKNSFAPRLRRNRVASSL